MFLLLMAASSIKQLQHERRCDSLMWKAVEKKVLETKGQKSHPLLNKPVCVALTDWKKSTSLNIHFEKMRVKI